MKIPIDELITVLAQFNPWWRDERIADLPHWQRAAFNELAMWVCNPPAPRAILLSGARQVGKTTLLLQIIAKLLKDNIPAANVLYATFDHPIIKLAGIDSVLEAWRAREPKRNGIEYLFLDEAQFISNTGTWIKHQVDFNKERRIVFTGSAMPLIHKEQESGVGRWHTIKLSTLSFYEYIHIKKSNFIKYPAIKEKIKELFINLINRESHEIFIKDRSDFIALLHKNGEYDSFALNPLPQLKSLQELFNWPQEKFYQTIEKAEPYVGHFHEYLVRGGFPQTAQISSITQTQRLLREDIIDKVLKRDMTALFGVRRVLELEQMFLYLCMHDGGLLDMQNLCSSLSINRPTAEHFIELLKASHLIYRLPPFGYGKEILRARYKVYLADAAISPAVLLKGKTMIDDPHGLGVATETAVFKHLIMHYYAQNVRFTYWRNNRKEEVDLIAEINNQLIPFEIKYRAQHTGTRELKGLQDLCKQKFVERAYVITKSLDDFGLLTLPETKTQVMRIPAPLFCYWMGESEVSNTRCQYISSFNIKQTIAFW